MNSEYRSYIARWYFYITPVFILLDYFLGVNVRVSALEGMPVYKNLYYGFCIFCGVIMFVFPRWSAVVAMFESSVNAFMIAFGIFVPYLRAITVLTDDVLNADWEALGASLSFQSIVNFMIVGSCLILTFRVSNYRIAEAFGFKGKDSERPGKPDVD
jgi:hypothetical protein